MDSKSGGLSIYPTDSCSLLLSPLMTEDGGQSCLSVGPMRGAEQAACTIAMPYLAVGAIGVRGWMAASRQGVVTPVRHAHKVSTAINKHIWNSAANFWVELLKKKKVPVESCRSSAVGVLRVIATCSCRYTT